MRYELFLRGDLDEEALASLHARAEAESLTADLYRGEASTDSVAGVDLGLETTAPPARAKELAALAFELAEAHGLMVFDPQLGRTVEPRQTEAIVSSFERSGAMDYGLTPTASAGDTRSSSAQLWLYVGGTLLVLLLGSRLLTCWI